MCKQVNETSKKDQRIARDYYDYYRRAWRLYDDIFAAYKTPSTAKIRAWEGCKSLCAYMNGRGLAITAAGCQVFSACFVFTDKETGKDGFCYITRDHTRFCYI